MDGQRFGNGRLARFARRDLCGKRARFDKLDCIVRRDLERDGGRRDFVQSGDGSDLAGECIKRSDVCR